MFEYLICNNPNEEIFYKQCAALEKHIPGLKKEESLQDVDNSLIQVYWFKNKKIKVLNDFYLNMVHIESEIDIESFFVKSSGIPAEISAEKAIV